jgi:hypothetical protein
MVDEVIKNAKTTKLVEFPNAQGGISIVEQHGQWNELTTPFYQFRVDMVTPDGRPHGAVVESVPALALAAAAFRMLKAVKQHLPEEALDRLFEQEIGSL